MKTNRSLLAIAALALVVSAGNVRAHGNWGDDGAHGAKGMGPSMMMGRSGGMGMMGLSSKSLSDEQLDLMADQIRDMHTQMARIAQSEDPAERRELVRQHLESMQDFMHRRMDLAHGRTGNWRHDMEERVKHMEEMMKQQ